MIGSYGFTFTETHGCRSFCTVKSTSTAQCNYELNIILTDEFCAGIYFFYLRVGETSP